jgi:hypothetical protein
MEIPVKRKGEMAQLQRFALTICLSATVVAWLAAPVSAGQIFYDFTQESNSKLVGIDTATGIATAIGSTGYSNLSGSAFAPDGTLYAVTGTTAIKVNLFTGAGSFVENTPTGFMGMAFASDGTAYLGTGSNRLWKRDWATGIYTNIGSMGPISFMDFAMNSKGELYAVGSPYSSPPTGSSSIYRIDTATGHSTLVSTVSVPCLMGLAFGYGDSLYGTEFCGGPFPLYQIDLSTGNANAIGTTTGIANLHGGDINPIPEPSTWLTAAPALGLAWWFRTARRRKARRSRGTVPSLA